MLTYNLDDKIEAFTTDRYIGRKIPGVVYPHQMHTDKVFTVTPDFFLLSLTERKAALEGVDALISNAKNIIMGISTADCIPVIVYDPVHHAAAAIHARASKNCRNDRMSKNVAPFNFYYYLCN